MAPKIIFERQKAKVKERDNQLTPLEIAAALDTDPELPFAIAPLLRSGHNPVGYVREDWSEDASYYTSRKSAKGLIVAFCGARERLGVPISYFLQMLRDDVFDAVVLRDPRKLYYTHGVRGLGGFLESMRHIKKFADANGFEQVLTFGNSMGGFPALRAGRLLGAHRAVSIGGSYPWHPGRLMRGETPVRAFDTLCACASPSPTELVAVYARGNERDTHANALLRKILPECIEVPIDVEEHGIFGYFYRAHLLPLFMACLLDYWDEAEVRTDLLTRLEHAARHSLFQESPNEKSLQNGLRRAEKENRSLLRQLEAVHESYSWRVTSPLRAIKRMFSRQH
jgi:hypothetical protein